MGDLVQARMIFSDWMGGGETAVCNTFFSSLNACESFFVSVA